MGLWWVVGRSRGRFGRIRGWAGGRLASLWGRGGRYAGPTEVGESAGEASARGEGLKG